VCVFFCLSLVTRDSSLLFGQVPAGTPVYNVNAKWVTDHGSQVYNVMAYGAKCDGVTDDAAAIQAAINAANPLGPPINGGAGIVLIPGGCAIGSTVYNKGILEGVGIPQNPTGINLTTQTDQMSYLKWIGPAGQPMVVIQNWYAAVRDLYLLGNTSANPSDGIVIDDSTTPSQVYGDHVQISHVYIGGPQFAGTYIGNGITWKTNASGQYGGDWCRLDRVDVAGCSGAGINMANPQASFALIDHLTVSVCNVGVSAQAIINGHNWGLGFNTTADIVVGNPSGGSGPSVNVDGIDTGPTPKLAIVYNGSLILRNGEFDIVAGTPLSQPVIQASSQGVGRVILENFWFNQFNSPPQWPQVTLCPSGGTWNTGQVSKFMNVTGLPYANISCPAPSENTAPGMQIEFDSPPNRLGFDFGVHSRNIVADETVPSGMTNAFDWRRRDETFEHDLWGGPFVLHQLAPPITVPGCTPTGSGSTTYGYLVTALANSQRFSGETLPSAEFTCTNASPLSGSSYNTINWQPVLGATGYNIYCRTPGAEQLCATVMENGTGTLSWVDSGSVTPSGAVPTANTTGRIIGGQDYKNPHGNDFLFQQYLDVGADGHGYFTNTRLIPTTLGSTACGTSNEGQELFVTDSTSNTLGATTSGGGSYKAKVLCDGTNWTVDGI
jgi:hypothetical protein